MNRTQAKTSTKQLVPIITASSVGTIIEWYDFYIFASLATIVSTRFFPKENPIAAFLATLATFSAGLVIRPFGALFFGRLGDMIGRKYTFMITLLLMGGSTFAIGLVPEYETIGFLAPVIILILRLLQGLAIGGVIGLSPIVFGQGGAFVAILTFPVGIITGAIVGATSSEKYFINGNYAAFNKMKKGIRW